MTRILIAVLVAILATEVQAGPFRRRSSSTCVGGNCSVDTSSAQGVANALAANRTTGHYGGNSGREGTGKGATPEAALRNCCFHPQNPKYRWNSMSIRDQGVAQGSDGYFYACIRE